MFKKKSEHPWFRARRYPHFDHPINQRQAEGIVTCPTKVASHGFYPFIEFQVLTYKVKRSLDTRKLKRQEKPRPIAYAAHVDCHIYSYYSYCLSIKYEEEIKKYALDECILAFRSLGKSNIDFAAQAFEKIKTFPQCHVLALDISGFFDNLDHSLLKKSWAGVLSQEKLPADHYAVFNAISKFATVNRDELYGLFKISLNNKKTSPQRVCSPEDFRKIVRANNLIKKKEDNKGIPQGSPISAMLSNIYMLQFDVAVNNYVKKYNGCYFRYCDDILIIVPPEIKKDSEEFVVSQIKKINLEINSKKQIELILMWRKMEKLLEVNFFNTWVFYLMEKELFSDQLLLQRTLEK